SGQQAPGRHASAASLSLPLPSAGDDSLLRAGGRTVMSRRRFIAGVILAVTPLGTTASAQEYKAQPTGKVWRIGMLDYGSEAARRDLWKEFREGLHELGY